MACATVKGISVCSGLGIAPVFVQRNVAFEPTGEDSGKRSEAENLGRLAEGVRMTRAELQTMPPREAESLCERLLNPLFHGSVVDRVRGGLSPEDAVVRTTQDLLMIFGESPDPHFRSHAEEVEEMGRRLFRQDHPLSCRRARGKPEPWVARTSDVPRHGRALSLPAPSHVACIPGRSTVDHVSLRICLVGTAQVPRTRFSCAG